MSKPRILISGKDEIPGQGKSKNYIDAIERSGGIATYAYLPKADISYDGLLICGGVDTHPKFYGEEINGAVNINLDRDEAELALLKAFSEAGKPVFGICRGCQLINIFFGGTLIQHIPEAEFHRHDNAHGVTVEADSIPDRLYGRQLTVNSSHHQVIKDLGQGLRATAHWEQYIEACEHTTLPIFGVQWHPERMCYDNRRDDTADGAKLFQYFIKLCSK